jgi:peptide/nickel transport system permease protein
MSDTANGRALLRQEAGPDLGRLWRAIGRRRVGALGISIMLVFVLVGFLAPLLAPHSPFEQDIANRLAPPFWLQDGTPVHLLGTDQLGRDLLSRVIYGARVSLIAASATVFLASVVGIFLGLIAGYFGGWWDELIMRIVDTQLSFPFVLLAILLAAFLGPSLTNMVIALVIASWAVYARIARASVLEVREREYVQAALAIGAGSGRILMRHILPNIAAPLLTIGSLEVGRVIIVEATLSFIGLGVQPRTPAWGSMLYQGREYMSTAWWLTVIPGLVITITVLGANLLGDWVRDTLDPRLQDR